MFGEWTGNLRVLVAPGTGFMRADQNFADAAAGMSSGVYQYLIPLLTPCSRRGIVLRCENICPTNNGNKFQTISVF